MAGKIFCIIPDEYYPIYEYLLKSMSDLGTKLIQEYNTAYSGNYKNIIDYWNIFQTAIAAYNNNELVKSDTIINYLITQLSNPCDLITRVYPKYVYYGDSDTPPVYIQQLLDGPVIDVSLHQSFSSPFNKNCNYIAIPKGIVIDTVKFMSIGSTYFYNQETGDDNYIKKNITINNEPYLLYYYQLSSPLNSSINVTVKYGEWNTSNIIYYGTSDSKPNISTILSSGTLDKTTNNFIDLFVNKKVHYFVLPDGSLPQYIQNGSFYDWLYKLDQNIDLYTKESILISNIKYTLWYCELSNSLNTIVKLVL